MSGAGLDTYLGTLTTVGVKARLEEAERSGQVDNLIYAYTADNGMTKLYDFVCTCRSKYRTNRLAAASALEKRAGEVFVELAVRWIDPHCKARTSGDTALMLAQREGNALPQWIVDVLSFYEKYYDARLAQYLNGTPVPIINPNTQDPVALDVINQFLARANETPFHYHPANSPSEPLHVTHTLLNTAPHTDLRNRRPCISRTNPETTFTSPLHLARLN